MNTQTPQTQIYPEMMTTSNNHPRVKAWTNNNCD